MKLSWFNTSMGTQIIPSCKRYEQHKVMQDIREIEFRDNGSNANTKIFLEVRATALRPRLHTEGFPLCPHMTSHTGNLHRGIYKYNIRSTQLLSPTNTTSTQEARHNNNHLYTQRDGHLAKQQSPLTRGIGTKSNQPQSPLHLEGYQQTQLHNLLYTQREMHKAKAKERVTTLSGLNKPQTNFLTKIRSYRQDRYDSSSVRK